MNPTIQALVYALENQEPPALSPKQVKECLEALQAIEGLTSFCKNVDEIEIGFTGCFYARFMGKHAHGETIAELINSLPQ